MSALRLTGPLSSFRANFYRFASGISQMNPFQASIKSSEICALAPVIPVLVIHDASTARALAEALIKGGLPALEVTLRTPQALDAIREMAQVEGGVVGAGTLLTPEDVAAAKAAGAKFGVSPGSSPRLLASCADLDMPLLPGVATATEAMALLELGYTVQKFFPAEANGGVAALKAIGGPIPQVKFCPTGGVSLANAPSYLGLSNTLCVGGSWVAPANLVAARDWNAITELAREASQLAR
jgi:2-dehydro-3-deoxyphosphogluconate aldolase/(4S)-4-hydroxy-2-oxoglutarate aldolase